MDCLCIVCGERIPEPRLARLMREVLEDAAREPDGVGRQRPVAGPGKPRARGHVVLVRITEAGRKAARVLPPAAAWEIVEDPIGQEHGQDPIGERHGGLSQAGPTARCCGRGPLAGLAEASVFIKSLKRKGLRSGEKFT